MFTVEEALITEYERILTGEIEQITCSFFDNCTPMQKEKYAVIIIRHALKNLLQLTPEQALKIVDGKLLHRLKLTPFLNYIRFPYNLPNDAWYYIVFLCYPQKYMDRKEKLIIYIYKKTLNKEERLPIDFFTGEHGKETTAIAFRYMIDKMDKTVEELYHIFSDDAEGKKFLTPFKLSNAIGSCFSSALDLLHYSLPSYMRSNVWYNYYNFKKEYIAKKKERRKANAKKD